MAMIPTPNLPTSCSTWSSPKERYRSMLLNPAFDIPHFQATFPRTEWCHPYNPPILPCPMGDDVHASAPYAAEAASRILVHAINSGDPAIITHELYMLSVLDKVLEHNVYLRILSGRLSKNPLSLQDLPYRPVTVEKWIRWTNNLIQTTNQKARTAIKVIFPLFKVPRAPAVHLFRRGVLDHLWTVADSGGYWSTTSPTTFPSRIIAQHVPSPNHNDHQSDEVLYLGDYPIQWAQVLRGQFSPEELKNKPDLGPRLIFSDSREPTAAEFEQIKNTKTLWCALLGQLSPDEAEAVKENMRRKKELFDELLSAPGRKVTAKKLAILRMNTPVFVEFAEDPRELRLELLDMLDDDLQWENRNEYNQFHYPPDVMMDIEDADNKFESSGQPGASTTGVTADPGSDAMVVDDDGNSGALPASQLGPKASSQATSKPNSQVERTYINSDDEFQGLLDEDYGTHVLLPNPSARFVSEIMLPRPQKRNREDESDQEGDDDSEQNGQEDERYIKRLRLADE